MLRNMLLKNRKSKNEKLLNKSLEFLNSLKEKYPSLEEFLRDEKNILDVRRKSISFVKEHFNNLNKWDIRGLASDIFSHLDINFEEETSEKFIFLIFTDIISEIKPESVPLIFFYQEYPIVKKHGIFIDFNILPEVIQYIDEISPEKKHQIVFNLYSEEELILKGISKYLSEVNFFILNLLDKVLFKEIVPFDKIFIKKDRYLQPNLETIKFIIRAIFSGLSEFSLNQKEQLSGLLDKKYTAYYTKIKKFIKDTLQDKDELIYLKEMAKADEESMENRLLTIRNYQTQKNVFEESKKREDIAISERIESIFWLLGIENINPVLLLRYYDTDDILYFLHSILKEAQDKNFLTENFQGKVKYLLLKLFQYPYLSKGFLNKKILDKPIKILFDEDKKLKADYYFFTRRYDEFLEVEKEIKEKSSSLKIKNLLAKFFNKELDKDELIGWLSLESSPEGEFFYYFFKNDLNSLPMTNEYRPVADLYLVKTSPEDIKGQIGEEGFYTLLMRISGFYPYDKTLLNLMEIKY